LHTQKQTNSQTHEKQRQTHKYLHETTDKLTNTCMKPQTNSQTLA